MHLHSVHAERPPARHANDQGIVDSVIAYLDPLDEDSVADLQIALSHRQLGRLLFIAAETGARFQREEVSYDPMAWMFSPRDLFNGSPAVDACQQREPFVRAMILHGLSLGFDAEPDELDALLADELAVTPNLQSPSRANRPRGAGPR